MIKLSIITINLNNSSGLLKTILSVINQTYQNFEYLIIDGASTDDSIEIVKKYSNKISYWISEPDRGIYNAMNKGIKQANGEYCLFLNSGDYLNNSKTLSELFSNNFNEDIVYGDRIEIKNGLEINRTLYPDKLTFYFFYTSTLGHQTTLIKRYLFENLSYYNENKKYDSDWELFMVFLLKFNCSYRHLPIFIANFDLIGISGIPENRDEMFREREQTFKTNFPIIIEDYLELHQLKEYYNYYSNRGIIRQIKDLLRNIKIRVLDRSYKSLNKSLDENNSNKI